MNQFRSTRAKVLEIFGNNMDNDTANDMTNDENGWILNYFNGKKKVNNSAFKKNILKNVYETNMKHIKARERLQSKLEARKSKKGL